MTWLKSVAGTLVRWLGISIIGLVSLVGFILFKPLNTKNLSSNPQPTSSYSEAVQRIEALQARETGEINPVCRLKFMTHALKAERAIVFVHGFTNCPQQFQALGTIFYDLGYNVLIAPMPHHGLADLMTPDQARLRAEELAAYADEVVDIAQGLGDHVTLAGMSAGGVTTAWAAQHRSDIDQAVIICPGFGLYPIPTPLTAPATNLSLTLPNFFRWWDPELKADLAGPDHGYPRYSTRGLGEILRLGFATQAAARQSAPEAQSILVVTNANDTSVNNALTAEVVGHWRRHGAVNLRTYEFEADLQLGHDLIDPLQPDQRTDIVYPLLVDLITR